MDNKTRVKLTRKLIKNHAKNDNNCWIWARATRHKGYGQITFMHKGKRKHISPHRLAYALLRNRLDILNTPTLFVCHRCDHKDCVNPEHMFLGTWLDNAFDDALRNDRTGLEHQKRILELYREEHGIRRSDDARKHFKRRIGERG